MKVFLILTIFLLNGEPRQATGVVESREVCFEMATKFLEQDPKDLDAQGLGAACTVVLAGAPS